MKNYLSAASCSPHKITKLLLFSLVVAVKHWDLLLLMLLHLLLLLQVYKAIAGEAEEIDLNGRSVNAPNVFLHRNY
jgi:hypothetical protein